ncbi:MAG TPA: hypothetical protein GXX40_00715 [Firmicutes bacterium]|nr:hypothetical protein [Bacillota bacterium]
MKWVSVGGVSFLLFCLVWFAPCTGTLQLRLQGGKTRLDIQFNVLGLLRFRIPSPSPRRGRKKRKHQARKRNFLKNARATLRVTRRFISVLEKHGLAAVNACLEVGGAKPERTAVSYGVACGLIPVTQLFLKKFKASVTPVFEPGSADLVLRLKVRTRLGGLILALASAAWEYYKATR